MREQIEQLRSEQYRPRDGDVLENMGEGSDNDFNVNDYMYDNQQFFRRTQDSDNSLHLEDL